ncbi:ClbS/DfsB family four-helix bundle protein [Bacillus sp. A301a_S52]|nr:ClbS/DfsB family four-helix bundle protein [Bacillus sp. A301a_S52]UJW57050.1 ClbS/DfsB family four-helix bundle protein [Bacillus sp. A116_S68]
MTGKSEKDILLVESDKNFKSLRSIIDSIPSRKRNMSVETHERDKNFRDVLMHLSQITVRKTPE